RGDLYSGFEFSPPAIQEHLTARGRPQDHVKVAVMVEIGDLGIDGGGFGEGPACVRSRVHKLVLTLIEVEQRRAVVAHKEQVGVAVIVKVSENRASHATLGGRKTGGGGQVRERAVAVVAVEAAGDA